MLLSNEALFSSLSNLANNNNLLAAAAAAAAVNNNNTNGNWPSQIAPFDPEVLNEFILQHFVANQASSPNNNNNATNINGVNTGLFNSSALFQQQQQLQLAQQSASNMSGRGRDTKVHSNSNGTQLTNGLTASALPTTNSTSDMLTNFLRQSGVEDLKSNLDVFIRHIESQKASQAELNAQFKSIQKALNSINAVRFFF
jgi:hypothetical protein